MPGRDYSDRFRAYAKTLGMSPDKAYGLLRHDCLPYRVWLGDKWLEWEQTERGQRFSRRSSLGADEDFDAWLMEEVTT